MVTGSAAGDHTSRQPRYRMSAAFGLLREAAEAAAVIWSGPLYPQAREHAQRQLCHALDDLRAVGTELAATDHRARLHDFSRCLDRAWRCAEAVPVAGGEPDGVSDEPGDVLSAAARHVTGMWKQQAPGLRTPDAGIAELLGAVRALADITGQLASGAGESPARQLGSVRGCLNEAAGHLRALLPQQPSHQGGHIECGYVRENGQQLLASLDRDHASEAG